LAVGELDYHTGSVLYEARHLAAVIDRHTQFSDPSGEYALDVLLPQGQAIIVPGRIVADIQSNAGEPDDLGNLPLRQEPIGNAALIEDLDAARVQTARAQAGDVLAAAPFDDCHIDAR
jgi:hypothetical protein